MLFNHTPDELLRLCGHTLDLAKQSGATSAEADFSESLGQSVSVRLGENRTNRVPTRQIFRHYGLCRPTQRPRQHGRFLRTRPARYGQGRHRYCTLYRRRRLRRPCRRCLDGNPYRRPRPLPRMGFEYRIRHRFGQAMRTGRAVNGQTH